MMKLLARILVALLCVTAAHAQTVQSTQPAAGQIPGTTTNDSACAGCVGEYVSSSILVGSAVALVNNTAKTITSISLTAGDWDVWIDAGFTGGATTTVNFCRAEISTTDNVENGTNGFMNVITPAAATAFASDNPIFTVGPARVSLNTTTIHYYVARCLFATSTASGFGIIQARRKR